MNLCITLIPSFTSTADWICSLVDRTSRRTIALEVPVGETTGPALAQTVQMMMATRQVEDREISPLMAIAFCQIVLLVRISEERKLSFDCLKSC